MKSTSLNLLLLLGTSTLAGAQERAPASTEQEQAVSGSRRLSPSELEAYLRGKKVALFGEAHFVHQRGQELGYLVDDMEFRRLIPILKRLGYTHLALEIGYQYEERVRKGIGLMEAMNLNIGTTAATIGPIAQQYGLEVLCIDNLDERRTVLRDEYMEQRIAAVVERGGKVAYFVGAGHLRLVDRDLGIATVELTTISDYGKGNMATIFDKVVDGGAKPVGKRLVERYGLDKVALVNMESCSERTIPTCYLEIDSRGIRDIP